MSAVDNGRSGGQGYTKASMYMLVMAMMLVGLLSIMMSTQTASYDIRQSMLWESSRMDLGVPTMDSDRDLLPDIEENYVYGTNPYDPDTDHDGMGDNWEVRWRALDPLTEQLVIDPVDPTDAFEDPDNDGYDYNHNGYIDRYDDFVAPSKLSMPPGVEYDEKNIHRLILNPILYSGTLVRLAGIYVMDNGSYAYEDGDNLESMISLLVAEETTDSSRDWLTVLIKPFANRPIALNAYNVSPEGRPILGDRVDVQGILQEAGGVFWLEVRGGEQFTNIMEYKASFYMDDPSVPDYDRIYNMTDPTNPDTDGDGMSDGWENHYGERLRDDSTGLFYWRWRLDPTSDDDAYTDLDGDVIETRYSFVSRLWVDEDGDGVKEPPDGKSPNDPVQVGFNIHEFMWGTDPRDPDSDNDSYPGGSGNTNDFDEIVYSKTNPVKEDSDGDAMWDGWEIFYNLQPGNASDRFGDEDSDKLVNYLEFIHDTHPRNNDTDQDIMWDGWEVEYQLDPRDPRDANSDDDVVGSNPPRSAPDGLLNWQEFLNGTNPRDPDTDRDHLTDYDEIVVGWYVTVNGVVQHYYTCATNADTDGDDVLDDEDGDGNSDSNEEVLDGIDNDGDSVRMQSDGIDNDKDGVVDDGRPGIPALGLPEGVDEEVDFNDYNEIFASHTNASNPDTDGDGLDDWTEWFTDRDPDTVGVQRTSPILSDTDSDGLDDKQEVEGVWIWLPGYTDLVKRFTNPLMPDTDSDGLADGDEVLVDYDISTKDKVNSTDPANPDTDGDGMLDGFEFDYGDVDGDGLPTWWERENAGVFMNAEFRRDTDFDQIIDTANDWDGDGLANLEEYRWRFDPWNYDTDGDGKPDSNEARIGLPRTPVYSDSDGDLMPDWWEDLVGLNPFDPTDKWADTDRDELVNIDEYIYNLDPFNPDTDGDGETDLFDHEIMSNPDCYDSDGDDIANWWEMFYGMDPTNPDDAGENYDRDNWTNFEEWVFATDPWNHVPTNPRLTSTDGDYLADDNDPFPVNITVTLRPLNPTRNVQSLNPIRAFDRLGNPESEGDMDQDGLNNTAEYARDVSHTNPTDPDTDGDGMPDGWEVVMAAWDPQTGRPNLSPLDATDALLDPDRDGVNYTLQRDDKGNYVISEGDFNGDGFIDPITENESFCNVEEYIYGLDLNRDGINDLTSDPNNWDSDGDGMSDGWETLFNDYDGDGLGNWYELLYGLNPFDPEGINGSKGDPDEDGYTNLQEFWNNTDPRDPSSHPGAGIAAVPRPPVEMLDELCATFRRRY